MASYPLLQAGLTVEEFVRAMRGFEDAVAKSQLSMQRLGESIAESYEDATRKWAEQYGELPHPSGVATVKDRPVRAVRVREEDE